MRLAAIDSTDDPQFTERVTRIIDSVVGLSHPAELYLVKVDNWFGPRWLRFAYKAMGAFGVASSELVVPPFIPNRIASEAVFARAESGALVAVDSPKPLHITQTSKANAGRRLAVLFPEAAFFWWSGQSAVNGRGSLMAYIPSLDGHIPWYVELSSDSDVWRPSVTKGISGPELERWM